MSIVSAKSGYFDDTTVWVGGVVPDSGHSFEIAETHVVTVRANTTIYAQFSVKGTLVIGDVGQTNIIVQTVAAPGAVAYNHYYGLVHVRATCELQLCDSSTLIDSGDLLLEGHLAVVSGATGVKLWILNFDSAYGSSDPRTITITNPQNVDFGGISDGVAWTGGITADILPPDGVVLKLKYTEMPIPVLSGVENIDLGIVSPANTVADYGFDWDWTIDTKLPLVYPTVNGVLVDAEVSVRWFTDKRWGWSFVLPSNTGNGSQVIAYAAHGSSGYAMARLRAAVKPSWPVFNVLPINVEGRTPVPDALESCFKGSAFMVAFPVRDAAGNPVDLSALGNLRAAFSLTSSLGTTRFVATTGGSHGAVSYSGTDHSTVTISLDSTLTTTVGLYQCVLRTADGCLELGAFKLYIKDAPACS